MIQANVKGNNVTPTSRNYGIKCFYYLGFGHIASQCLNKIVMVMKAYNEVEIKG
jgi:hypothetical protein